MKNNKIKIVVTAERAWYIDREKSSFFPPYGVHAFSNVTFVAFLIKMWSLLPHFLNMRWLCDLL